MDQKRLIEQPEAQNGERRGGGGRGGGFLVSDELKDSDSCPAPAANAATRRSIRTVNLGWRVKTYRPIDFSLAEIRGQLY